MQSPINMHFNFLFSELVIGDQVAGIAGLKTQLQVKWIEIFWVFQKKILKGF